MKLLVAVDGSAHATKAVETAGRIAAASGAEVVVVHQVSAHALDHGPAAPSDEDAGAAQGVIDAAVAAALGAGATSARGRLEHGLESDVAQAVLDVARDEDADVIVVGPRGHSLIQDLLLGSVTEKLVHHADRPVLVVR